jgi:hypothetical protein
MTGPRLAGPELIADLERALGVGVMVQSIDDGPPMAIEAVLMLGPLSEAVRAEGTTDAEAWRELARIVVAWRSTNDKHVPMWPGAGGGV